MDPVSFVIMEVVQVAIAYLFPSQGPRMKDLKITASTYGASIPWTFGVTRVAGNMIWSQPIREHKRERMNGKGGFYIQYKYTCSFAMGLCRGPLTHIRRVWADGKLLYDRTGASEISVPPGVKMRFYMGTEDQLPNSTMMADKGEANTPAYRGLAYIVFDDLPLDNYSNRIPQITAEVYRDGVGAGFGPFETMTVQGQVLGSNPSFASYQSGQLFVDTTRGYYYLRASTIGDHGVTVTGLQRYSISGAASNLMITDEMHAFPNTNDGRDNQELWAVIGVSPQTGQVMVQHGFNNNVALDILDAGSYRTLATIGTSDPFSNGFTPTGQGPSACALCTDANDFEWVLYRGLFGQLVQANFLAFDFEAHEVGHLGSVFAGGVICGEDGQELPSWYTFEGGHNDGTLTTHLTFQKLGDPTQGAIILNPEAPGVPDEFLTEQALVWDVDDPGAILLFSTINQNYAAKWSKALNKIVWQIKMPTGFNSVFSRCGKVTGSQYAVVGTSLFSPDGNSSRLYILDTRTGKWLFNFEDRNLDIAVTDESVTDVLGVDQDSYRGVPIIDGTNITAADDQFYDGDRQAVITISGGIPRIVRIAEGVEETTLGLIVSNLLREGGLTSAQFDTSLLDSVPVLGYGWARGTDIKSILDELRRLYLFDLVERQGKLVGVPRATGSDSENPGQAVAAIPQNVLGSSSAEATDFWQETRLQEADLPEQITLAYMNFDDDYQAGTARSKRISNPLPTMFSRQQVALQVSVVMHPAEAKNRLNMALYAQWAERTKHSTRLPWAYLNLDPADLISVTMNDGRNYFDRIDRAEIGADLAISAETFSQDAGAYVSNVPTDGGGSGPSTPIFDVQPAKPLIVNTPLLRDQDDTGASFSAYYAGVGNAGGGTFRGAALYRAIGTTDYLPVFATDTEVEWGTVGETTKPPRHGCFALDWETKVTVWPNNPTFEIDSISDDDLWAGGNAALIGDEIIQFRDAVQNPNGSWTLSNLLRGRRGTEYACDNHRPGETFIFLSAAGITLQGDVLDSRGQARSFKAVGERGSLDAAAALQITYEPRDLMPYAPADIRRAVSGGSVTLTWARRTRLGGGMQDFTGSVPLNEAAESYEVYVLAAPFDGDLSRGNAPTEFLFSTTTTTPTLTWTPGSTAVFDVDLDTLHVVIYQVSAAVGRGFPGVRSIEPWQDF